MPPLEGMNPRYAAYCRAHAAVCKDEMMARDRARWPGGPMVGFMQWIQERWREWLVANGKLTKGRTESSYVKSQQDHDDFDAWLEAEFP